MKPFARRLARLVVPTPAVLGAVSALAVAGAITLAPPAEAKAELESRYGFERTWNAGLRLVRVDLGLKVAEKDDATGYVMFDYRSPEGGDKTVPGSLELIRPLDPDGPVRVVVQIPKMPRYHEQVVLDALGRKLRSDYGDPPARRETKPPKKGAGDGAADAGAKDDRAD